MVLTRSKAKLEKQIKENEEKYNKILSKKQPKTKFYINESEYYLDGKLYVTKDKPKTKKIILPVIKSLKQLKEILNFTLKKLERPNCVNTKEEVIYVYNLINNKYGREFIKTYPPFKKIIFNRIYEYYYLNNCKEFYKIYRDLFGRRIPDEEYYRNSLYGFTCNFEDVHKSNTKLFKLD